jgi:hypothetical protein
MGPPPRLLSSMGIEITARDADGFKAPVLGRSRRCSGRIASHAAVGGRVPVGVGIPRHHRLGGAKSSGRVKTCRRLAQPVAEIAVAQRGHRQGHLPR